MEINTNFLSKIKKNNILIDYIFNEVPFYKLLLIFRFNKQFQKILKVNIETYKRINLFRDNAKKNLEFFDINKSNREEPNKNIIHLFKNPLKFYEYEEIYKNKEINNLFKLSNHEFSYLCIMNKSIEIIYYNFKTKAIVNKFVTNIEENIIDLFEISSGVVIYAEKNKLNLIDTNESIINSKVIFTPKYGIISVLKIIDSQFIISSSDGLIDIFKYYDKYKCEKIKTIRTKNYIFKNLILIDEQSLIISAICSKVYNIDENKICVLDIKKSKFLKFNNNIKNKFISNIIKKEISNYENFIIIKNLPLTSKFVTADINGNVYVWDHNNKNYFLYDRYEHIHNNMINDIIEIDKNIFASIAHENKLIIYNYIKEIHSIIELNEIPYSLFLYSPKILLISSLNYCVYIFDVEENKVTYLISGLFSAVKNFYFNSNGSITSLRFSGLVDIFGIYDINEFEYEGYKKDIINYNLKESKKLNKYYPY